MPVEIRAATLADIPAILTLAAQAKALLKARNINQWQDDYPQPEIFEQDLRAGAGFVVCHAGQVAGYFAVLLTEDPNYHYIENGAWHTQAPYATLHRLMLNAALRGSGAVENIFQFWLQRAQAAHCRALRGDTHPDNRSMQHFFARRGFKRCGVIYVHGGQNRDAFEKPL